MTSLCPDTPSPKILLICTWYLSSWRKLNLARNMFCSRDKLKRGSCAKQRKFSRSCKNWSYQIVVETCYSHWNQELPSILLLLLLFCCLICWYCTSSTSLYLSLLHADPMQYFKLKEGECNRILFVSDCYASSLTPLLLFKISPSRSCLIGTSHEITPWPLYCIRSLKLYHMKSLLEGVIDYTLQQRFHGIQFGTSSK